MHWFLHPLQEKLWLFFFLKGAFVPVPRQAWVLMAYETLKAQIADLNGDLGVHQRLLPGAFWKKTRGGLGSRKTWRRAFPRSRVSI